MTTAIRLDEEVRWFREHKAEFIRDHGGQYVLIKDTCVLGFFDSWDAAFEHSVQHVGMEPCLIKQILEEEPVHTLPQLLPLSLNGNI